MKSLLRISRLERDHEYNSPMRILGNGKMMKRLSENIERRDETGSLRKNVSHVLVISG